jgi:hypothetical protein
MDPRIPDAFERFPFLLPRALPVLRVEWVVDGQLVGSTGRNEHQFLWPLVRDAHTVQARVWQEGSNLPMATPAVEFAVK